MPSSFPQGDELETYGTYLHDLVVRLSEIQRITAHNMVKAKVRSKEAYDRRSRPLNEGMFPFETSTGIYYEHKGLIRCTASTWRVASFLPRN